MVPMVTITPMQFTTDDSHWMDQALAQAKTALFRTSPNPRVGCVIVAADGQQAGMGATQPAGQAHAEVMALRDAAAKGVSVQGGVAYVTLEPCAHQGRTGPCCDALAAAGISRVVASLADPNPQVSGQGFARLRAAGITVEVGLGAEEARELNLGFLSRMTCGIPWVRMKLAASLDGTTALQNGASQWITGAQARADGHVWRARACAVLTGIGTVLADNPRLDVRGVNTNRQPRLVVVDSDLKTPLNASIFIARREVIIYTSAQNNVKKQALEALGAVVVSMPGPFGKVDLAALLRDLGRREVNELHVEAGFKLNGSLVREGLVDEFLVYLAPKLLGLGQGMVNLGTLTELAQGADLAFTDVAQVGPDLRLLARLAASRTF
jgi:diaminohydroxyphosphoribosylaminopyrimidine deaminase/5-amino-6-(5-phosphoribosylamino)uracil reductase